MNERQYKPHKSLIATLAIALAAACPAHAQIGIVGKINLVGSPNVSGQPTTWVPHPYTHIWAYAPPDGADGANDNDNFRNNVMTAQSAIISGVSILEAWNNIEISAPDSNACIPSDICQPDPVVPQTYHHYDWTATGQSYDSTVTGNPVYQWLQLGAKVNLLIAGEASGSINPITPHYVTSPAWYNLFNPQQQDVINGLKDCTGEWGGGPAPLG